MLRHHQKVVWAALWLQTLHLLGLKLALALLLWAPLPHLSELKKEEGPWPEVGSQRQGVLEGQRRWEGLKGLQPLHLQGEEEVAH